jgi:hypothetical protein
VAKKKRTKQAVSSNDISSVELQEHVFWILTAALTLGYFILSFYSDGFYQDDEIGHYQSMRGFWLDPLSILGNWQKPGFKILYVVPAALGYNVLLISNALTTALVAYAASVLAREVGVKARLAVFGFVAFQPLLYQLSFRTYSELSTALLLTLLVISLYREYDIISALLATYLFTIRQELALIAVILGVLFLFKKKWIPFLLLGASPVLLVFLGWLKSGDWMWFFNDVFFKGVESKFVRHGFFHYFKLCPFIVGHGITGFILLGLFGGLFENDWKAYYRRFRHGLWVGGVYFLIHCLFTSPWIDLSASAGNLRYILVISPLVAVLAGEGWQRLWQIDSRKMNLVFGIFGAYLLINAVFLSYEYNYVVLLSEKTYMYTGVAVLTLLLSVLLSRIKITSYLVSTIVLVAVIAVTTLYTEPPKKNSEENKTVKQMVEWMDRQNLLEREILINHPMFYFYADILKASDPEKYPGLFMRTLETADSGDIVIWDSHYSYRPVYKMDVQLEYFQDNPDYRLLQRFVSRDQRYVAFIIEKN